MKYLYSLPFPELAAYLDHQKSLYVKNTNKLVWKNNVVNTNGWYGDNIAIDLFGVNDGGLIRIIEKRSGEKKAVEVYSYDYKKLKKVDFDEITPKSEGAEIKFLSEALEDGNYVVAQEFEVKTTLPENTDIVELAKTPVTFKLFQRDLVELDNAKNKKYFRQDQEFTTFLLNAYEKGLIKNAYTSDSLTTVLSKTDWEKRMEMQNFLFDESEKATQPKVYYTGQQANTLELNWEVVFNKNGEIISKKPHSLTLFVAAKHNPASIMYPVATFAFADVEKGLQQLPEYKNAKGNMLNDLKNQKYFGFLSNTSAVKLAESK